MRMKQADICEFRTSLVYIVKETEGKEEGGREEKEEGERKEGSSLHRLDPGRGHSSRTEQLTQHIL